jgi:hypothetical protein
VNYGEIFQFYREVKADCTCFVCSKHLAPETYGDNPLFGDHQSFVEFHHVKREDKTGTVFGLMNAGTSGGWVLNELLKCVPLCSNHHKLYHFKENLRDDTFLGTFMDFTKDEEYLGMRKHWDTYVHGLAPAKVHQDFYENVVPTRKWESLTEEDPQTHCYRNKNGLIYTINI